MSKKYNVRIKMVDGRLAVLSANNRTAWGYKTANKHCVDVQKLIIDGKRPDYVYAVVVED